MVNLLSALFLPALALFPLLDADEAHAKGAHASVGEAVPELQFRTLLRGDGRDRLSQFIGQPVLIAYYSTVFAGMEAAKGAFKIEQDFAKQDVVVILMELQKNDETYIEALAAQGVPGSKALLTRTQDLPITFDSKRGLPPHVALIGVDGTLLYAGTYQQLSKVKKLLKADSKRLRKGWGEDRVAKSSRALAYGKGQLGNAHLLVQEALQEDATNTELVALEEELSGRYAALSASIGYLVGQGRPEEALASGKKLSEATSGHPVWEVEALELLTPFKEQAMLTELQWDKKLNAVLKPMRSKAPTEGLAKKVRNLAEEAVGTRVAERATRLAKVIDFSVANDLSAGR